MSILEGDFSPKDISEVENVIYMYCTRLKEANH